MRRYVVRFRAYYEVIDVETGRRVGDGFWTRSGARLRARVLNARERFIERDGAGLIVRRHPLAHSTQRLSGFDSASQD